MTLKYLESKANLLEPHFVISYLAIETPDKLFLFGLIAESKLEQIYTPVSSNYGFWTTGMCLMCSLSLALIVNCQNEM